MERLFIYVSHEGENNIQAFQTEKDIEKSKNNPDKPTFFSTRKRVTPAGQRVIFYKEKHALAYGPKMKEYLGAIEIDPGNAEDQKIYQMSVDEIRALNLPRIAPNQNINKVVFRGGQSHLWKDFFRGQ